MLNCNCSWVVDNNCLAADSNFVGVLAGAGKSCFALELDSDFGRTIEAVGVVVVEAPPRRRVWLSFDS